MDALGRSSGSSEPTRSRPRVAPLIASPATSLARERRGCSSLRFFDRDLLSLPSQPPLYSTNVSQTLRNALRSCAVSEFPRRPLPRTWVNKGTKKGRGCYVPALLVRFATPSFGRFLRNLLAVPLHLDEVDGHLAFGVHAVAHQNMHSYLRAVRPPGRALLDAGVGTNELVEAPGVDRLELYKVPGIGRACPVCGDIEGLPLKQAVRMEWREEVTLCVSAGGGDV